MKIRKEKLLNPLPPVWAEDLLPIICNQVKRMGKKIVVLDDDPTGTQTVYNVPVLTEWSTESLIQILSEPGDVVYILTNSRSLPLRLAQDLNRVIAWNLKIARQKTDRDFVVVSRSDSTLRGHYPGEVHTLMEAFEERFDGTLIVPFFLEGGRITVNDIHYVAEDGYLIPAAETEYARDAVFTYRNSNLRQWVCEKHGGSISPQEVASISIENERVGGPDVVADRLARVSNGQVCVVNAATYRDLDVFVTGLLQAEAAGKRFIYRTAASFVRVRGGLAPRPLLTAADLTSLNGCSSGLVIAGSYIQKSTDQIESVRKLPGISNLEVRVEELLEPDGHDAEIDRVVSAVNQSLAAGITTLVYTSRKLVTGDSASASLQIGRTVSNAIVKIVQDIESKPAWLIAKGGITSSDVATKGLRMKRAEVLGQAIPGVPVWMTGSDSRWPGLIYVVFPGNVGGPDSISEMIRILGGGPG